MRRLLGALLALATVAAACSGGDEQAGAADEQGTVAQVAGMSDEGRDIRESATSGGGSIRPRVEGVVAVGGDLAQRVYVEIGVRGMSGTGVEVAVRLNATTAEWLPRDHVFDHEAATAGEWWFSSPLGLEDGTAPAVRVQARRLEDGRVEVGLSTPDGTQVLPRRRFVPRAALATEKWSYSSPVVVNTAGEPILPEPESGRGTSGFLSLSVGFGYEWDEWPRSLQFGDGHGCGIRPDHSLACWGNDWDGQASPPEGEFAAVDAGWAHACAIRLEGDLACWGTAHGKPPSGPFVAVSAGNFHSCGVRPHGGVECWGDNSLGQSSPPEGVFTSVSAGKRHTCGLRLGGRIACWGSNTGTYLTPGGGEERHSGQAQPPDGEFDAVSAGSLHTCGIRPGGQVECWGNDSDGGYAIPRGHFVAVSAADHFTCGIQAGGGIFCWTAKAADRESGAGPQPWGDFESLSVGDWSVCGIRPDGDSACWRRRNIHPLEFEQRMPPPAGRFAAISAGRTHTCGIRISGALSCWDDGEWTRVHGHADPPEGLFTAIDAGAFYTCGIRLEGTVQCWGRLSGLTWWGAVHSGPSPGEASGAQPPSGNFESVQVGGTFACALRPSGEAVCWGDDDIGRPSPPQGAFAELAAGDRHVCGLRPGGTVTCWGDGSLGQIAAPDGTFTAIRAGDAHTCGLKASGEVACWGHMVDPDHLRSHLSLPADTGGLEPPGGVFVALSAGSFHSCGIRPAGDVECWPRWGVEGSLYDDVTFPVKSVARRFSDDASTATFMTLENPAPLGLGLGEPGIPGSSSGHGCDITGAAAPRCRADRDEPGYVQTPVISPVPLPHVWQDSRADPLPGPFISVSAGRHHTCGIRPDNTVDCWDAYAPRN